VRSYGEYCPIARAAEVLGDRWTMLIVREMNFGVHRFNELERCLPGISRSVLAQRLRQMTHAGLIERREDAGARATEYVLTPAGRDLKLALHTLGEWAAKWAFTDPSPRELDPDLVIRWISRHVAPDQLPERRLVVEFDVTEPKRRYWLVLEPAEVSVCLQQPGFDTELVVTASTATLYDLYFGRSSVRDATRAGRMTITGRPALERAFPRWFTWSTFAPAVREGVRRGAAEPLSSRQ
jgi:DNA-binding HxlR family transcriptional regulator